MQWVSYYKLEKMIAMNFMGEMRIKIKNRFAVSL